MESPRDIVITGVGVVSPIGIGVEPFWAALAAGVSGIRPISLFDASSLKVRFGGQIADFEPKLFVRPRKSLKVMSREIQLGFAAADLAIADAALPAGGVTPERFGVTFGGDMIYADLEDLETAYRRAAVAGSFDFPSWAEAIHEEGFAPLAELMANFVKAGGKIWVCSPCMKKRKLDENNLVDGATIVGGAKLVEFLSDGTPCVSY